MSNKIFSQNFSPSNIPNLALWLSADTGIAIQGVDYVSQWTDLSGSGLDASQSNGTFQPRLVFPAELCGKPALQFDGQNDELDGLQIPNLESGSMSLFIIGRTNIITGSRAFFSVSSLTQGMRMWHNGAGYEFKNNGNAVTGLTTPINYNFVSNAYNLISVVKDFGVSVDLYKNTSLAKHSTAALAIGSFTNANYILGRVAAASGTFLNGEIAEIIVYKGALTVAQRQQVETYLENKYAAPVNLGADITIPYGFCATTITAGNCFTNYLWSTGATSSSISVSTGGLYSVTATDIFGRQSTDDIMITYPNVNISAASTTICAGEVITIGTYLPSTIGYSFQWQNAQTTPTIGISNGGNYSVTVTDDSLCSAVSDTQVFSIDNFSTTVSLGPDLNNVCAGNTIGLQFPANGWDSLQFLWSDNSTDSLLVLPSTNTYTLTVTNANGCSAVDTIAVTVVGTAPTVTFSGANLCLGDSYNPSNTTAGLISNYEWSFGDGGVASIANPTYNYSVTGTYNVSLSVTSSAGCSSSATHQVIVKPNPVAIFQTTTACINNGYQFNDLSLAPLNESINSWNWNFGDASAISVAQNPSHIYSGSNNYSVTLIISATNGCMDTIQNNLNVVANYAQPQITELVQPQDNYQASSQTINFIWSPAQNAVKYSLLIATDSLFTAPVIFNNIYTTQYAANVSGSQVFYWKVVAYNICNATSESDKRVFTIFLPADLSGLALWLKADTGIALSGSAVTQWSDQSGHAFDAVNNLGTAPSLQFPPELCGKPALLFDGINDILYGTPIPGIGTSSLSLFIVAKPNVIVGNRTIFSIGNDQNMFLWHTSAVVQFRNATQILAGGNSTAQEYYLFSVKKNIGVGDTIYRNGVELGAKGAAYAGPFLDTAKYQLGKLASVYQNFSGEIAEVILYNTALNPAAQQQVENYLYNKYSSPVHLGPDITVSAGFCPVQLNASNCYKNYLWSTNETTATINVNRSGVYSVAVTDIFGRVSLDTIVVTFPNINLTVSDTTICLGNILQLQTQLPSLAGYTFDWSTGETSSSIQTGASGNYSVQVSYGNCAAFSDTITLAIDTFENVVSLGSDTSMCSGNLIGLKAPTIGWDSFQFQWSTGASTVYLVVPDSGNYSVTVTNAIGCKGYDTIHITKTGSTPNVTFTGGSFCLGLDYVPQNSSVSTDTSAITGYSWDFGDGGIASIANPTYSYTDTGNYVVTLSVTTSAGCLNYTSQQVLIKPIPTAAFQPTLACVSNPYLFTDLSTAPIAENINQWDWNFGDGTTHASTQNPQHLFSTFGNYSVSLTVTATNGCSNSITNSLQVVPSAPQPQIVNLQSPVNNFQAGSANINFSWLPTLNASSYSLYISTDASFLSPIVINGITATQYSAVLSNNPVFYWKVRAFNVCNDFSESVVNTFTLFEPSFLPNLALWLAADLGITQNAGKVSQWNDQSGNNLHALQLDPNKQAQLTNPFELVKPALQFDGSNDEFAGGLIQQLENGSMSLFVVGKANAASGNRTIFSTGTETTGMFLWATQSGSFMEFRNMATVLKESVIPNSYFLSDVIKTINTNVEIYKNSSLMATGTAPALSGTFVNQNYSIGKLISGYSFFSGELAELIIYKSSLSAIERGQVENYIYNKYSPAVNLGPDTIQLYSLCPITIDATNRFKEFLWSNGETSSSISVNRTGIYSVTATDVFDRTSTDAINVTMPYTAMSPVDTTICLGQPVNVHPVLLSSASGYTFLWSDGLTTYTVQKDTTGNYSCLITDVGGCSLLTDTTSVHVDSISLLSVLPTDSLMCIGNDLAINTGNYPPSLVLWSTAATTTFITIASAGNYSVSVTDIYGCSTSDIVNVTIKGTAPIGDFTSGIACYGQQTGFTDITIPVLPDSIHQWNWNFGDNTSSLLQNPFHAFPSPGDYSVTLILFTDSGCTGVAVKNISVHAKPVARLSYPGIICAGNSSQLLDESSLLPPDSVTNWLWRIDQTNVFNTSNVSYNFPTQGNVLVTLVVTTNQGCVDSVVSAVEVFPALHADFNFLNICLGDSTKFVDITNSFSVVGWQWNFGDGSFFSALQNPTHRYLVSGLYPVKLTIENAIGCTDTVAKQILIVQNPIANFTNLSLCEDLNYTPLDSSLSLSESIQFRDWNINGSLFHHVLSPQYYFADTGNYSVKLLVTTYSGCKDSITKTVQVHPNPVSTFAMAPLYGEAPVDITLTNHSSGATGYDWNFGDGSAHSFAANTSHTYTTNDSFNIVLTVSSDFGCTNSSAQTFYVSHTDLDLSVDVVEATSQTQTDGSVLVAIKTLMSNVGTRAITHIHLYATLGTGGLITEDWNGVLPSGQVMQYTFTAQFVSSASRANSFVCVEAKTVNHGETETRIDNNRQCASLTGTIQLVGPSPNPAFNQSTLGIILPKEGKVAIEIADVLGHLVVPKTELDLPEGRTDFEIPTGLMLPAEYFIRVTYNEEKTVRKFILQK
ncbi:MAG: PKD domain-containing protein [Bacteroidetes bacterium]|nr:PKD domain-containing protein [Bacteroidota bacterium]